MHPDAQRRRTGPKARGDSWRPCRRPRVVGAEGRGVTGHCGRRADVEGMVRTAVPALLTAVWLCCQTSGVPLNWREAESVTATSVRNVQQVQTSVSERRVTDRVQLDDSEHVTESSSRTAAARASWLHDHAFFDDDGWGRTRVANVTTASEVINNGPNGTERVVTVGVAGGVLREGPDS
ncbi:uncharacterized protein LOC119093874 isoform X2 [Pollicipes pollicipes]|uniref:uncharacterized protein LOC119093874 isoform X2 n=1 Tax=Pollicipes pollicipes TaxID=41117 RepID=UPI0018856A58|nr:uncharacterized protein LOC119093874 isoform X2 [Pollicipes pollicipes]XP_037072780.1 uncharacterized protein LOC119093874 isoform X2 [Pollicipes pollicipes]XP_037072783.1 uncharacterized protein LOC119093874 isoform X2 [Pollicipes pollicipes]